MNANMTARNSSESSPPGNPFFSPLPHSFNHLLAGSLSALFTTSLLHPLDVIKVRFQANEQSIKWRSPEGSINSSKTTFGAIYRLARTEGARSLYLGLTPAVLANAGSWGLYFYFYEELKPLIGKNLPGTPGILISGILAGMSTTLFMNPIWLIKTRMQLENSIQNRKYRNLIRSVSSIIAEEGFKGLYRGIIPAFVLTTHGAVQFAIYEELKHLNQIRRGDGKTAETQEFFVMGGISKLIASIVTYPFQVVKTRMQKETKIHAHYQRMLSTIQIILKNEGLFGFYKGLGANLWRVAPQSAILLSTYENIMMLLVNHRLHENTQH